MSLIELLASAWADWLHFRNWLHEPLLVVRVAAIEEHHACRAPQVGRNQQRPGRVYLNEAFITSLSPAHSLLAGLLEKPPDARQRP